MKRIQKKENLMTEEHPVEETPSSNENLINQSALLKERFEICFDAPLPELNSNQALAFVAKDNINPQRQLFALVCSRETSPRSAFLPYLKSIDVPHILKLIEYGTITNIDKTEAMALIYNRPIGPRADFFSVDAPKITPERFK